MASPANLLDESLGLDAGGGGRVVLIEDCVETSGAFVLHHIIKRSLSPQSPATVIFVAFAQPFSHYDRILRKMGCNLFVQKDNKRFLFFDMLMLECPDEDGGKSKSGGLLSLYGKIHKAVEDNYTTQGNKNLKIIIDDLSLMEVAASGSSNHVLNFLHYCHTLTTQFGCSLITLNHRDIYLSSEKPTLTLQIEYLADVVVKAEPLATGLAADVHGQLTIINNGVCDGLGSPGRKICSFHFRLKENGTECFYPGSRP